MINSERHLKLIQSLISLNESLIKIFFYSIFIHKILVIFDT
jgi:hypothetical protein